MSSNSKSQNYEPSSIFNKLEEKEKMIQELENAIRLKFGNVKNIKFVYKKGELGAYVISYHQYYFILTFETISKSKSKGTTIKKTKNLSEILDFQKSLLSKDYVEVISQMALRYENERISRNYEKIINDEKQNYELFFKLKRKIFQSDEYGNILTVEYAFRNGVFGAFVIDLMLFYELTFQTLTHSESIQIGSKNSVESSLLKQSEKKGVLFVECPSMLNLKEFAFRSSISQNSSYLWNVEFNKLESYEIPKLTCCEELDMFLCLDDNGGHVACEFQCKCRKNHFGLDYNYLGSGGKDEGKELATPIYRKRWHKTMHRITSKFKSINSRQWEEMVKFIKSYNKSYRLCDCNEKFANCRTFVYDLFKLVGVEEKMKEYGVITGTPLELLPEGIWGKINFLLKTNSKVSGLSPKEIPKESVFSFFKSLILFLE